MSINWAVGTDVGNPINYIAFSAVVHRRSRARQWFIKKKMTRAHRGGEEPFERRRGTPIVQVEKLGSGEAQQVRIPMLLPLQRSMRSEGTTWEGNAADYDDYTRGVGDMIDNEERIRTLNTVVWTQNMQHATGMYNPALQDLRTAFKMSLQVTDLLSEWQANAEEELYLDALYERFGVHITGSSLAAVKQHPNQLAPPGVTDVSNIGSGHRISCAYLRGLRSWIEATGYLNPIEDGAEGSYVLLLHTYCCEDLMADPEYQASMQNAMPRSLDNPMFQYADMTYAGFHIYNYARIRQLDSSYAEYSRVRMNILLGADALGEATTQRVHIVPRNENKYQNVAGWAVKKICGQGRFDFLDENSANPINQSSAIVYAYTSAAGGVSVLPVSY